VWFRSLTLWVIPFVSDLPTPRSGKNLPASVSPLQLYLQEISRYPLLDPEEEYALAVRHFEEGDISAAHRLITSNLRLVVKIANDFRRAQTNLLDLIQEGNHGLMHAVKKFNPYKGVKLSSYSAWWIRAFILKHIMDNASQVKIGTTAAQRKLFFNLKREADRLIAEHDHADPAMIAKALNVPEKDVIEMQKRLSGPDISMDAPISEDSTLTRENTIASGETPVDDVLATEETRQIFAEHLTEFEKTLTGRDLEVYQARMMSENPLTLQDLGDRYGISRERLRQIEARIISKLKEFVREKGKLIDV